ncbi:MAG: HDOD domain-containing protein [Proteobacteria bacterium]|nr:HDOD domain-containing protein [Pseudomonadota bacterium]
MQSEISTEDAKALMRGMVIPPRPDILLALEDAQACDAPDFAAIARLISVDVALSAAVIKTVNSPFFSLSTRVSSVQQALQLLGLKNLANIVQGVVLRQVLSSDQLEDMSSFWDFASALAGVAAYLSSSVHGVTSDDAYTLGLFLNCGKPLMAIRFPGYAGSLRGEETLSRAELIVREEGQYQVSHNVVGFLLARTWYLPQNTSLAILHMHDFDIFKHSTQEKWSSLCTLVALGCLAEHIVNLTLNQQEHAEWAQIEPILRNHLGLGLDEFEDLVDSAQQMLNA